MKYYDDLNLGLKKKSTTTYTFTAEEIKSFATSWDPMPFHTDEEVAANSPIGKLFASSVHTIAAGVKLTHSMMDEGLAAVAGLGWNDLNFPKPVFAGDTIRVESELIAMRESKSKPDRGIINTQNIIFNQHDEVVAEFKIMTMVLKNPDNL